MTNKLELVRGENSLKLMFNGVEIEHVISVENRFTFGGTMTVTVEFIHPHLNITEEEIEKL